MKTLSRVDQGGDSTLFRKDTDLRRSMETDKVRIGKFGAGLRSEIANYCHNPDK